MQSRHLSQSRRVATERSTPLASSIVLHPPQAGVLHGEDLSAIDNGGIPRGPVTIQVLFDPPGHGRLPINDGEIVDRAVACKPFAGELTMLTYDTGQAMRARLAGLQVRKPTEAPAGDSK
jgi:hypothetical protein